jgi:Tetratricopeptide repeat
MAAKGRRLKGEGSIYQRASDGLWVGMLDLGVVDGRRHRKTVYGQAEREVRQKLGQLRASRDRGIDLLAPSWTVGQWLDAWLSERLAEAIPLYERTLTDREQVLGETHPDTLTVRNNLAAAYQDAGRLDEAEGLQNRSGPRL